MYASFKCHYWEPAYDWLNQWNVYSPNLERNGSNAIFSKWRAIAMAWNGWGNQDPGGLCSDLISWFEWLVYVTSQPVIPSLRVTFGSLQPSRASSPKMTATKDYLALPLKNTPALQANYDTTKRSLVIVDGSPHGISAILAHRERQGQPYKIIAEHRRPKAAMRSPIPIEPMHSFSYGHLRQR